MPSLTLLSAYCAARGNAFGWLGPRLVLLRKKKTYRLNNYAECGEENVRAAVAQKHPAVVAELLRRPAENQPDEQKVEEVAWHRSPSFAPFGKGEQVGRSDHDAYSRKHESIHKRISKQACLNVACRTYAFQL